MLEKLQDYVKVKKLADAKKFLAKPNSAIVAGGTSVAKTSNTTTKLLVDISELGLNQIKLTSKSLKIGATATIGEIFESNESKKFAGGILQTICKTLASTPLRNLITVGGNVTQIYPWSDLPPFLLAANAKIKTTKKTYPVLDFYKKHPTLILSKNEIVTEIEIPVPNKNTKLSFEKFSKTNFDYALLDVAVSLEKDKKKIKDIKIAVGAAAPIALRFPLIEKKFKGKEISKENIELIASEITKKIKIIKDFRASQEYKKEILEVLIKRNIENCL